MVVEPGYNTTTYMPTFLHWSHNKTTNKLLLMLITVRLLLDNLYTIHVKKYTVYYTLFKQHNINLLHNIIWKAKNVNKLNSKGYHKEIRRLNKINLCSAI